MPVMPPLVMDARTIGCLPAVMNACEQTAPDRHAPLCSVPRPHLAHDRFGELVLGLLQVVACL